MARNGRRASSVPASLPAWNRFDVTGAGRFRRDWSPAQRVESELRLGARPGTRTFDETAERKALDPAGILEADSADVAEQLAQAQVQAAVAQPLKGSWDEAMAGVHQDDRWKLTEDYQSISGEPMPPLADLGAVHQALSRALARSGAPKETLQKIRELLELHGRVLGQVAPHDDIAAAWRTMTEVEAHLDWTSAACNTRLKADLTDEQLAGAIQGYCAGGPDGFWGSLLDSGCLKEEFLLHLRAVLKLDEARLVELEERVRQLWMDVGGILMRRLARDAASGKVEAGTEDAVERLLLKPWQEWAATGDAMKGESEAVGSDGREFGKEEDGLSAAYDTELAPGITFGDWMRWEFIDQWIVPARMEGSRTAAALAARMSRLDKREFCESLFDEHRARNRAHFQLMVGGAGSADSALLYLRRLTVLSNVPGANSSVPAVSAAAERAVASPAPGLLVDAAAADLSSSDPAAYDAAEALAIICEQAGGCRTPAEAAATWAQRMAQARSESLMNMLEESKVGLENREDGLRLCREVAEDAQWAIGHLLRVVRAERLQQDQDVSVSVVSKSGDQSGSTWHRGTVRSVRWVWKGPEQVEQSANQDEQSAERGTLHTEQVSKLEQLGGLNTEGAVRRTNRSEIDEDAVEAILRDALKQQAGGGGGVDSQDVDMSALHRIEHRLPWALLRNYTEWQMQRERESLEQRLSTASKHPVHVALYRKADDAVRARRERWSRVRQEAADHAASPVPERKRLAAILEKVREYTVQRYLLQTEHVSPLRDEFEVRQRILGGELSQMLATGSHLSDEEAEAAGELWEYQCALEESGDFETPNNGELRVRLPFRRRVDEHGGFPFDVDDTLPQGEHRVTVHTLAADGSFASSGHSESFATEDPLEDLLAQYRKEGRAGLPPLRRLTENGEECLIPVREIPALLAFLKSPDRRVPLDLDIARECSIGNDVVFAAAPDGSGKYRPSAKDPCVHIDVLRYELRADHHADARRSDPLRQWAYRNERSQKAAWMDLHPGSTAGEWAESRARELRRCTEEEAGWWAHDPDATRTPNLETQDPLDDTVEEYLHRKALSLSHVGCAGAAKGGSALVTARYEGAGYVSELNIGGSVPVRVLEPQEEVTRTSFTSRGGDEVTFFRKDGTVHLEISGESSRILSLTYRDDATGPHLSVSLEHKDKPKSILLPTDSLPKVIGELKSCGIQNPEWDLPSSVPHRVSIKQLAGLCLEAINDAHSKLCNVSNATVTDLQTSLSRRRRAAWTEGETQEAQRRALQLPTVLRAWEDGGAADADSPVGLSVQRRRFDSMQLLSGQGRYDAAPVQGTEWMHPIEEGAVQYHYEPDDPPMTK
eukprot:TRINITY_DN4879_c0_g1_i1.p1 TRINITY_DN4879_c0_g1~~TRINITY_DN4879_c0_g1_i1.p1  ORF type:complete len:1455 (+),score=424.50 TRINITY_DN4879_c0_g1_i1:337-4365(+)